MNEVIATFDPVKRIWKATLSTGTVIESGSRRAIHKVFEDLGYVATCEVSGDYIVFRKRR